MENEISISHLGPAACIQYLTGDDHVTLTKWHLIQSLMLTRKMAGLDVGGLMGA